MRARPAESEYVFTHITIIPSKNGTQITAIVVNTRDLTVPFYPRCGRCKRAHQSQEFKHFIAASRRSSPLTSYHPEQPFNDHLRAILVMLFGVGVGVAQQATLDG